MTGTSLWGWGNTSRAAFLYVRRGEQDNKAIEYPNKEVNHAARVKTATYALTDNTKAYAWGVCQFFGPNQWLPSWQSWEVASPLMIDLVHGWSLKCLPTRTTSKAQTQPWMTPKDSVPSLWSTYLLMSQYYRGSYWFVCTLCQPHFTDCTRLSTRVADWGLRLCLAS